MSWCCQHFACLRPALVETLARRTPQLRRLHRAEVRARRTPELVPTERLAWALLPVGAVAVAAGLAPMLMRG